MASSLFRVGKIRFAALLSDEKNQQNHKRSYMTLTDLMAITSGCATFVGFVAADEQQQRVKNGTFGALAGTSLGAVGAIANKTPDMLLWAAFGASVGAVLGWIVHLGLCMFAASPSGRRVLEYVNGGLSSVKARLDRDDTELLLKTLETWTKSFGAQIARQAAAVGKMERSDVADDIRALIIRAWMASFVDAFNVIFSRSAGRREYRLRASLIVFGRESAEICGKHWIAYSGELPEHRDKPFTKTSIAYRVLSGDIASPTYQKLEQANKDGQDRGEHRYSSFYAFRVSAEVALAVDWPEEVVPEDPLVAAARNFVHVDLEDGIQALLQGWSHPISEEVHLSPLVAAAGAQPKISPLSGPEEGRPIAMVAQSSGANLV
jgi:hypothetical protein